MASRFQFSFERVVDVFCYFVSDLVAPVFIGNDHEVSFRYTVLDSTQRQESGNTGLG